MASKRLESPLVGTGHVEPCVGMAPAPVSFPRSEPHAHQQCRVLQIASEIAFSGEASHEQTQGLKRALTENSLLLRRRLEGMRAQTSPLASHGGFVSRTVDALIAP